LFLFVRVLFSDSLLLSFFIFFYNELWRSPGWLFDFVVVVQLFKLGACFLYLGFCDYLVVRGRLDCLIFHVLIDLCVFIFV